MGAAQDRADRDLSRLGSIRVGGLFGGRFGQHPPAYAAEALRRNIKGRWRRKKARERIDRWLDAYAREEDFTFAELPDLLACAPFSAAGPDDGTVFIDLEIGAGGRIEEVGVAFRFETGVASASGDESCLAVLETIMQDRMIVAHNGHAHDFVHLGRRGISLPSARFDSLLLAYVGWPTSLSHSLGYLAEAYAGARIDPDRAHHAGQDARQLAELWPHLLAGVASIPASQLSKVEASLIDQPEHQLFAALSTEREVEGGDIKHHWSPDEHFEPQVPGIWTVGTKDSAGGGTAIRVVDDLREILAANPATGIVTSPDRVVDRDLIDTLEDAWVRAVAYRLTGSALGLVDLGPAAFTPALARIGGSGEGPLLHQGVPLVCLATTVVSVPLDRPLTCGGLWRLFQLVPTRVSVDVALPDDGLWDIGALPRQDRDRIVAELEELSPTRVLRDRARAGDGVVVANEDGGCRWLLPFPDPEEYGPGIVVETAGPVGGPRSKPLWDLLFGQRASVSGPSSAPRTWARLDGVPRRGGARGRRAAWLLALAGQELSQGRSALVVDSFAERGPLLEAAPGIWRRRTNTNLLRSPAWPTLDEATRRLRRPHVAIVDHRVGRRLAPLVDEVIVGDLAIASSTHPTLQRLYRLAGDGTFTEVAEPLRAHLAAELVCSAGVPVTIVDAGAGMEILADLLGRPAVRDAQTESVDRVLHEELLAALPAAEREPLTDSAIRRATGRLLGPDRELREFQVGLIDEIVAGHDTMGVYRTGLGKSLCYQVPALAYASLASVTVVVSPLLSLQRDQVDGLRARGVHEVALYNSELPVELRKAVRQGLRAGFYGVVLLAPEALRSPAIVETLRDLEVRLLVVDEAHCISEMGHDFRPDYRTIPRAIRTVLGLPADMPLPGEHQRPTLLALTGTASPEVRADVIEALS